MGWLAAAPAAGGTACTAAVLRRGGSDGMPLDTCFGAASVAPAPAPAPPEACACYAGCGCSVDGWLSAADYCWATALFSARIR